MSKFWPAVIMVSLSVLFSTPGLAQGGDEFDTTDRDPLSIVSRAPGAPQGSVFAGFEDNESVSLYNGNLLVTHPSSPTYPIGGGMSVGLQRSYSSKSVYHASVHYRTEANPPPFPEEQIFKSVFQGTSWVGAGWTMHLGRVFRRSEYTSGGYGLSYLYFEDATGTQHSLQKEPLSAQPKLRWSGNDAIGYDITYPNGTKYHLARRIPHSTSGSLGWINNSDRGGWYTTSIQDPHGNLVQVNYHTSALYLYPEAIREVWVNPAPDGFGGDPPARKVIWTTLDDNDMLDEVHVVGPEGTEQGYKYSYTSETVNSTDPSENAVTLTVWTLTTVDHTDISGNVLASIGYEYGLQASGGPGNPSRPVLRRIDYPTGGVSEYGYKMYVAGYRGGECPFPEGSPACVNIHKRKEIGVVTRRRYPYGKPESGNDRPFSEWSWSRAFFDDGCEPQYHEGTIYQNEFTMTLPDGRVVESTFSGDPCGDLGWSSSDGPQGWEKERKIYDGAGVDSSKLLRAEEYAYDFIGQSSEVMRTLTTVTLTDDDGSCFDGTRGPSLDRQAIGQNLNRTPHNRWKLSKTAGYYVRNVRFQWREFVDPPCQGNNFPLDTIAFRYTEEGNQRTEARFTTGCYGDLELVRLPSQFLPTAGPPPAGAVQPDGPDDIVRDPSYYSDGNLRRIEFKKDSTLAYAVDYTWDKGLAVTAQIDHASIDYPSGHIQVDDAGHVTATFDPNGLRTDFDYDGLGRVTKIDPPGTVELSTRAIYPTLNTTHVIQSPGIETDFEVGNKDQIFSKQIYDGLGRTIEEWRAMPDDTQSVRVTRYDSQGRVSFNSEWIPEAEHDASCSTDPDCSAWHKWEDNFDRDIVNPDLPDYGSPDYFVRVPYKNGRPWGTVTFYGIPDPADPLNPLRATPDGLGRVRRVEKADGSVIEIEYCGPHQQLTVKNVTIPAGSADAVTRYYYDGLGRLAVVDAPEGTDAAYRYDVNGNLTEVRLLDLGGNTDPFETWLSLFGFTTGQTRNFTYDAIGRLKTSTNPENGTTTFHEYDVWGNLLQSTDALGAVRGYFFKNTYDPAGRLTKAEKVTGAPGSEATTDVDRLAGDGEFKPGHAWQVGTLNGQGEFVLGNSHWNEIGYGALPCLDPPPNTSGNKGMKTGSGCFYSNVPGVPQALRHELLGVTRDDFLTFKYWRQVREGPGAAGKDVFSVFVVLKDDVAPNTTAGARYLFELNPMQSSFARWEQTHAIRPGDLFTTSGATPEWPEKDPENPGEPAERDLYLYFVFNKGDNETAITQAGIFIDDVFLGRRAKEKLAEYVYDANGCTLAGVSSEMCGGAANFPKGKLTQETSYQSGRAVSRKTVAYDGLNGRLGGESHQIDWEGHGEFNEFIAAPTNAYNGHGQRAFWSTPYRPGTTEGRQYSYSYRRGFLTGVYVSSSYGYPLLADNASDPRIDYNPAGGLERLRFNNGAETTLTPDAMYRPGSLTVTQGTGATVWNSGVYEYDGAGNIKRIGAQTFAYDLVGQLAHAEVLPQAKDPNETTRSIVDYTYDMYGNMESRTWSHGGSTANTPLGMAFDHTHGTDTNRIEHNDFAYDANGNLTRMLGGNEGDVAATWDERNRMTSFYDGKPEAGGKPSERYVYDASGYRILRTPSKNEDGHPRLYIRDGAGQLLAQYIERPADGFPVLQKDFVYGVGQLLVERTVTEEIPEFSTDAAFFGSQGYCFNVQSNVAFDSYFVDIRTPSLYLNQVSGVVPDATGKFCLEESEFALDETNYIRVSGESGESEPFSRAVTLAIDSTVTSESVNQVRAISVSKPENDTIVRFALLEDNGEQTYLYFNRADGGGALLVTPQGLNPGVSEHVLAVLSEAMLSPLGGYYAEQADAPSIQACNNSDVLLVTVVPGCGPGSNLNPGGEGDDPPPPDPGGGSLPEPPYTFVDSYHHRDHVGSLRAVTDAAGRPVSRHDFYPFGIEMVGPNENTHGGSRMRFTGHERDEQTGMDYMMARYGGSNLGRFVSVDPIDGKTEGPQSWNRFAYAVNNPVRYVDPTGLYVVDCQLEPKKCEKETERFEKNRQDLLKSKDPEKAAAAASYGNPKEENGITVAFVNRIDEHRTRGEVEANDPTFTIDAETGKAQQSSTVRILHNQYGRVLRETILHEGSHLVDRKAYTDAIHIKPNRSDESLNITIWESERRAFRLAQGYTNEVIDTILNEPPYSDKDLDSKIFP